MRKGAGRRVGLMGGSFNPPHEGHRQISLFALQRLQLSEIWWLVTPGNPLKDHSELAEYDARLDATRSMARHPRIKISDFERREGIVYTAQTIDALRAQHADLAFVWIMGADNLAGFHRWESWRAIMRSVPIAVLDRPGYRYKALASPAATAFASSRIDESDAGILASLAPPAWAFLSGPLNPVSSTMLRRNNPVSHSISVAGAAHG